MTDVQESYDVTLDVGIQPRSYEHVRVEIKRTGIATTDVQRALMEMGQLMRQGLMAGEGARQSLFIPEGSVARVVSPPEPAALASLDVEAGPFVLHDEATEIPSVVTDPTPIRELDAPPPMGERFSLGE